MEILYDQYSAALYGVIKRMISQDDLAAEALQDTFLKIWKKIDQYDPEKGRLFTWMINIARNTAIDKLRSADMNWQNKSESAESLVYMKVHQPDTDHIGVRDLLNQLNEDQRELFNKIYFGGYTQSEVAEEMNIPLGTVKTRVRNGLLAIRKYLDLS